jgi:hypothetical protein
MVATAGETSNFLNRMKVMARFGQVQGDVSPLSSTVAWHRITISHLSQSTFILSP